MLFSEFSDSHIGLANSWLWLQIVDDTYGDILFFGYVQGNDPMDDEYGYFSLKELESITLPWGLKIERDLYFDPTSIEDIKTGRKY